MAVCFLIASDELAQWLEVQAMLTGNYLLEILQHHLDDEIYNNNLYYYYRLYREKSQVVNVI